MLKQSDLYSLAGFFMAAGLLLGLPLLGAWLFVDEPLRVYFDFPPEPGRIDHAPFSWPVFWILFLLIAVCLAPFVVRGFRVFLQGRKINAKAKPLERFPAWGHAGLLIGAVAWIFSWTRFSWFGAWQPYTFPLLWLGYIIAVNALCQRRTGACRMLAQPVFFALLFMASAVFWWFFEYLNRFVLNWYYVDVDMFGPAGYILYATICFSTVLPAVWSTADLLASYPFFRNAFGDFIALRLRRPGLAAGTLLTAAAAGLFLLPLYPNWLFPLLWVSPLLIIVCFQALARRPHLFSPVARGKWDRLVCFAAAALVCGFFWEMWNFYSLARWEYSIPFVHGFKVFEMPLPGYAGYLPFGLECAAVGDIVKGQLTSGRGNLSRVEV